MTIAATGRAGDDMAEKGKILVVDDDRLVLATLVHGLAQAGYHVIDADNGDDAILLAREHRPALALLDIRMEGKSGFDVAEILRDRLQIPFMFLSAFADDATVAQVKALGAVAYLVKPLDIGQIVPAVDAVFARRSPGAPHAPGTNAVQNAPQTDAGALPALALAVGLLMHRHSLDRAAALQRLRQLAAGEGQTPEAQAARLLDALELLARSGGVR
jgi:response regulator NasT